LKDIEANRIIQYVNDANAASQQKRNHYISSETKMGKVINVGVKATRKIIQATKIKNQYDL